MTEEEYIEDMRAEAASLDNQIARFVVEELAKRHLGGQVPLSQQVTSAIDNAFQQSSARFLDQFDAKIEAAQTAVVAALAKAGNSRIAQAEAGQQNPARPGEQIEQFASDVADDGNPKDISASGVESQKTVREVSPNKRERNLIPHQITSFFGSIGNIASILLLGSTLALGWIVFQQQSSIAQYTQLRAVHAAERSELDAIRGNIRAITSQPEFADIRTASDIRDEPTLADRSVTTLAEIEKRIDILLEPQGAAANPPSARQ